MTPMRARWAAEIFLASLRRSFVAANPEKDCPVKRLEDYEPSHQVLLTRAVSAAAASFDATQDRAFNDWQARRMETSYG